MRRLDGYIAYALCIIVFSLVLWLNYVFFFPGVDIIEDKSRSLQTTKGEYAIGETITLSSSFTKLQDAKVIRSVRYVECLNDNGTMTKYMASTADAPLGVKKGTYKGRKLTVIVPFVPHGEICRVRVETGYRVRLIRSFSEYNVSNTFGVK